MCNSEHESRCGMRLMPLLIVDGQVRSWDVGENTLKSEDIDSVEVLKGDKAVARFGVDARDGVVIIATAAARRR
jgi:outer membrane receptor for ferrienterochelin and colicin